MDPDRVHQALVKLAAEIAARHPAPDSIVLVGIPTRGVPLAARLSALMEKLDGSPRALGAVDVSMHRDDQRQRSRPVTATDLPFDLERRVVVLVDDVAYTGRTCRSAIEAVLECGRPPRIEFAALVDRGLRQLPIAPDYTGIFMKTTETDRIRVRLAETDGGLEGVWIDHGTP
jgi:pyrimidine operon attenuation protein/uracil phosphoribosyltransferase